VGLRKEAAVSFLDRLVGRKKRGPDPRETYAGLRSLALSSKASHVGLDGDDDLVYGVVMDLAFGPDTATIVSLIDGSTSMYTSTGGGVIGGGVHANVAAASKAFISAVAASRHLLSADWSDGPLHDGGVRVIALVPGGALAAVADSDALAAGGLPLSPVFLAGEGVISELRVVSSG
jgi:hypothetical protein